MAWGARPGLKLAFIDLMYAHGLKAKWPGEPVRDSCENLGW